MDLKTGFKVGAWEVRPLTGEITGGGESARLEPKVMEVLVALAQRPGEVLEREELLRLIWGNRAAVSDEPLTRCIAELRRALGDSRQTPTYIQTIPKRGYRLLSAVTLLASSGAPTAPPTTDPVDTPPPAEPPPLKKATAPRRKSRAAAAGVGVLAVVALAALTLQFATRNDAATSDTIARNTLAVLPFADDSDTTDDAYFSEGVADEIRDRLSTVRGLRVVARTSSFSARGTGDDVRGIAQRLRVAHVLEGDVLREGERIRIRARLIDAQHGYQLWAANYDGVLGDIFALQCEIVNTIVAKLRDTVPGGLATAPTDTCAPTTNLAAYELLLRGRQFLHRRDEESLRRSIRLFEEAIELDPGYGQAYVELAKAYVLLPYYSAERQDEMFARATATLDTGVERDPAIDASTRGVLAEISSVRWEWSEAHIHFRRALEHTPNDPDLLVWYSEFLSSVGRLGDSLTAAQRAKDADPLSPIAHHRLSVASLWVGKDDDAAKYAAIAEDLGMAPQANPDSYIVLKLRLGDRAKVRPLLIGLQTMFARPTAWVDPLLDALRSPERKPQAVEALTRAEDARDIPRKYLFGAWVYLDEPESALATAMKLVNDRPSLDVQFLFARETRSLRENARFGDLVRAIGLNRYWDQFGWPAMCTKKGEQIVCH